MNVSRYLCSELVRLVIEDGSYTREHWANLEEIWADGAMVDCEEEVRTGASAEIRANDISFAGRVTAVECYEDGWRVEVTFSPPNRWTIEQWRPEHAINPGELPGKLNFT